jgi:16S rRNA processing protein RimM
LIDPGFLLIGEVTKPHGLRGHLKVHSYASSLESFLPGRQVYLSRSEKIKEWVVSETKTQGHSVLLKLQGLDNRQQAEELVGYSIYLNEKELKALPEGEYYWYQLIGSRVYDDQDRYLGVMKDIISTAAHDIWVVRDGEKETLFPAVEDFILSVNQVSKEIRVRDLYGLSESDDH